MSLSSYVSQFRSIAENKSSIKAQEFLRPHLPEGPGKRREFEAFAGSLLGSYGRAAKAPRTSQEYEAIRTSMTNARQQQTIHALRKLALETGSIKAPGWK